jgi:hypothetical protein
MPEIVIDNPGARPHLYLTSPLCRVSRRVFCSPLAVTNRFPTSRRGDAATGSAQHNSVPCANAPGAPRPIERKKRSSVTPDLCPGKDLK